MNRQEQDLPSEPDTPDAGHGLRRRRLHDHHASNAVRGRLPLSQSDADKYRWIRANRGNFAIVEALKSSNRDADFDAQIEAAMRMSASGRHYFSK